MTKKVLTKISNLSFLKSLAKHKTKWSTSGIIGVVIFIISTMWIGFAFFSDIVGQSTAVHSGNLSIKAVLAVDGVTGEDLENPGSTTFGENAYCDNLACNGQDQGAVDTILQANKIHNLSYQLTNIGTVDYKNYTGDKVAVWLNTDYMLTDYIQFDGNSWIDTGVDQTGGAIDIAADFQYDNITAQTYSALFGARVGATNNALAFTYYTSYFRFQYGTSAPLRALGSKVTDRRQMTFTSKMATLLNNGAELATYAFTSVADPITPLNIYIGGVNQNGANLASQNYIGKIYSFSITKAGIPQRDFMPVYQVSTGECGLYDTVSETFFANIGTGTISCTPNPLPYKILLFPNTVPDSTIYTEMNNLGSGQANTAPSAIANVNGVDCVDDFYGTDPATTVCLTTTLTNTINTNYQVDETRLHEYKFVVYKIPDQFSYFSPTISFGLVTGAQGTQAVNWKQQIRPYVEVIVPIGNPPALIDAGKNRFPFIGQVPSDDTSINNYLMSLASASDIEDGDLTSEIVLVSDGGFDPNTLGEYVVEYIVTDSDGNIDKLFLAVEVWNFTKVTIRADHALALGSNGSVWAWGRNANGRLGDGTTTTRLSPIKVPEISEIIDIAVTESASFAISADGTVYSWGDDTSGQLGNGAPSADVRSPAAITIPDLNEDELPVSISAMNNSVGMVTNQGNVYTWGANDRGKLGVGDTTSRIAPVKVLTLSNIRQISMGYWGASAVDNDGFVWNWGTAAGGRLGNGATTAVGCTGSSGSAAYPCIPNMWSGVNDVKFITTGYFPTFVVKNDNTLVGWGPEDSAELGNGGSATDGSLVPITILPDSNFPTVGIVQADAYYNHSVACSVDHKVYGWGYSNNYFLGPGITGSTNTRSPIIVSNIPECQQVSAGTDNTLALSVDGTIVYSIGRNTYGQLGDNTTTSTSSSAAASVWNFIPNDLDTPYL